MRAIPLLDVRRDLTLRDLSREIADRPLVVREIEGRRAFGNQARPPTGTGAGAPFVVER